MPGIDDVLKILRERHGEQLNVKDHVYYVWFKDALVSVYAEDKEIKIDVELLPENNAFIYLEKETSFSELAGIKGDD